MGDSLQNALKKALAGKKGRASGKKKSSKAAKSSKDNSMAKEKANEFATVFSPEQIDAAESFSELMKQAEIEALENNSNKVDRDSPPAHPDPEGRRETRRIRKYVFGKKQQKRSRSTESTTSKVIVGRKNKPGENAALKAKVASADKSKPSPKQTSDVTPSRPREQAVSKAEKAKAAPAYTIHSRGPINPHSFLIRIAEETKKPVLYEKSIDQIVGSTVTDEREVNIGLDFGTSSVKVVIGDSGLNKAFAVPFHETTGLETYLLPSRIWKERDNFTLNDEGRAFRNLKLQLTRKKCTIEDFSAAAAFLALVIRHARCWLLKRHSDIYKHTKIAWKLTLGLPAENYNNRQRVTVFRKLAAASWRLSMLDGEKLPESSVQEISTDIWRESFDTVHAAPDLAMIDFDVVPELSAQVYGFLTSTKFDPNARNIFMIVDVGAGTIDSSVFHVKRERAKRLSFEYYANFVEFNGVANLHAARMKWYRSLGHKEHLGPEFETVLKQVGTPSDFTGSIPESICDYFEGIDITFSSPETSPDDMFFKDRVKAQILSRTLKKARNGVENHRAFAGMPVFVCGGGSRMKYYKKLERHLLSHPNASWFRFKPRRLEVPDILEAPGVMKNDFDRLSVAFGLSFVRVAQCVKKTTPPPPSVTSTNLPCPGCGSRTICYCS